MLTKRERLKKCNNNWYFVIRKRTGASLSVNSSICCFQIKCSLRMKEALLAWISLKLWRCLRKLLVRKRYHRLRKCKLREYWRIIMRKSQNLEDLLLRKILTLIVTLKSKLSVIDNKMNKKLLMKIIKVKLLKNK